MEKEASVENHNQFFQAFGFWHDSELWKKNSFYTHFTHLQKKLFSMTKMYLNAV